MDATQTDDLAAAALARFDKRRDEASFRRLYRAHTPRLFGFAVHLCHDRTHAEELVQETWMRAVANHERFDGIARYESWLTGILVNCHREAARARAKAPRSMGDELPEQATPARDGERIDIERALGALPEGFREVLILHDVNGYTHAEIATLLGISEGTSKSQLHRGRARLRELLTGEESTT